MKTAHIPLYKRGRVWWVDLRALGKGRVSTGQQDRTKAIETAHQLMKGRDTGQTLSEALDRAWAVHYAPSKGARNVESQMRVLKDKVGTKRLADIDTPWVVELSDALKSYGCKTPTVNRYLALLSKTLKLASEWGWITGVPYMPRGKEGSHRIRVVTGAEEMQLLMWFNAKHAGMLSLTAFLLDTGCRLGEALGITEKDRENALEGGRWTIWETKGGKARTIPLTSRARIALREWDWKGMTARQCQDAWSKARTAMHLQDDKDFVIHALRHTCASRLVNQGKDIYAISKYLGHANVSTTQRYAHLRDDALDDLAMCLESVPQDEYHASVRELAVGYGAGFKVVSIVEQRVGETVNLTAQPSEVQILPPPPNSYDKKFDGEST